MLYKPSYAQPYLTDIDASEINTFSCILNAEGGTQIVAYKLTINDLNNTEIYSPAKQTLASSLYNGDELSITVPVSATSHLVNGTDYLWKVQIFETNPTMWVASGKVVTANTASSFTIAQHYNVMIGMSIKIGTETRTISAWDSTTGILSVSVAFTSAPILGNDYTILTNFVISDENYFRARTTPSLAITSFTTPIASRLYKFEATYTQAENIEWKYFVWNLYDEFGVLLDTSGQINTGLIEYTFDGFVDGNTYQVQITTENQNGVITDSAIEEFSVDYYEPIVDSTPTIELVCEETAMKVTWSQPFIDLGSDGGSGVEPRYEIVAGRPFNGNSSVEIFEDNYLYWIPSYSTETAPIPVISTTLLNCTFPIGFIGDIVKLETIPITLIAVSSTEPVSFSEGDLYYNTVDKLIYEADTVSTWSNYGNVPESNRLYQDSTDSAFYTWDGTDLNVTTENTPSYIVSYDDGIFTVVIDNEEIQVNDTINIADSYRTWLFDTISSFPASNYVWDDNAEWDDDLYWSEQTEDFINNHWFKITLLPTNILIDANIITTGEAFTSDTSLDYRGMLFIDDYMLQTDIFRA